MNILVFGVQGSGKSTHAEYIANKLGLPYIYTGDIFREIENEDSQRGERIRKIIKEGKLVPDDTAVEVFEEYLGKFDTSKGFVLDGFPRTLGQAKFLKNQLDLIVYIDLSADLIIKRLLERGREDDNPETIKKRISLFEEKTKPILDYYKEKNVEIVKIDNTPPIEEVRRVIDDLLEDK